MVDLINCRQIDEGYARQKRERRKWSFDEVMKLR